MTKTGRVSLLLVAMLSLATALMAQRAATAQSEYPPASESLAVSDTSTEPGQSIEVSGTGFQPRSRAAIVLGNVLLRTVTVDALGNFRVQVTIPCPTPPGPTRIEARGTGVDGRPRTVSSSITVAEGGCPAAGPDVATTGTDVATTGTSSTVPLTLAGFGLVLAGTSAAVMARRRAGQGAGATAR